MLGRLRSSSNAINLFTFPHGKAGDPTHEWTLSFRIGFSVKSIPNGQVFLQPYVLRRGIRVSAQVVPKGKRPNPFCTFESNEVKMMSSKCG